jgi:general secretion pathway protein H
VSWSGLSQAEGYTLAEMLTVLSLLALFAMLSFPGNIGSKARSDMDSQAKTIVAMLKAARLAAISGNTETSVDVNVVGRSIAARGSAERLQVSGDIGLSMLTAQREAQSTVGSIRFFPDGTSTGGTLELKRGEREIRLEIQWLTGKISRLDDQ